MTWTGAGWVSTRSTAIISAISCTRCQREAPTWQSPEYADWELDPGGSGEHVFGLICPGCITAVEQEAINEGLREAQKKMERQLRESARRRAEQRRAEGLE